MEKYNGFTNRATWLVNLYYDEMFIDYLEDMGDWDIDTCTLSLQEFFESVIDEDLEDTTSFIKDMLDLSEINWKELTELYIEDL